MKSKLKIIIPIIVAVIAIIIAALMINFTSDNGVNISSLIETAQNYLNENKYEQAIAEFEKAINIDPMNVDAYIGLAQAYIGIGDSDKAIETLEKGIEATGDQRLKDMLDELSLTGEMVTSTSETVATAVPDNSAENDNSESSQIEEVFFENKVEYADGWYSVFRYNENKDITNMYLYNKNGKLRLEADYVYEIGSVKRTVYIDDQYYKEENVIFTDIMADVEAKHKRKANTTETQEADNGNQQFKTIYDENGKMLEYDAKYFFDDYSQETITYYNNGITEKAHSFSDNVNWSYDKNCYYDDRGYEVREEGIENGSNINIMYTYQNDENGYPIIQYANGEKTKEYYNFYNNNNFKFGVCFYNMDSNNINDYYSHYIMGNFVDQWIPIETDNKGMYLRELRHDYYHYPQDEIDIKNYMVYYVPSYDGNKIIDSIYYSSDYSEFNVTLFECPYCNE